MSFPQYFDEINCGEVNGLLLNGIEWFTPTLGQSAIWDDTNATSGTTPLIWDLTASTFDQQQITWEGAVGGIGSNLGVIYVDTPVATNAADTLTTVVNADNNSLATPVGSDSVVQFVV